jgi:molybdenum cofactor cytidylyltransferase
MICAIVLAAGRSRRMGRQKLLLPWGNGTMLGHVVAEIARSPVAQIFVVVCADGDSIARVLSDHRVTLVTNPDPDSDMLASVRCGLRVIPSDCDAVLLALGDQPSISSALIGEMIRNHHPGTKAIVVPVHSGQRGHPLLFSAGYGDEILTRFDGVGVHALLTAHSNEILEVPAASDSVLVDIDSPADYQSALVRSSGFSLREPRQPEG